MGYDRRSMQLGDAGRAAAGVGEISHRGGGSAARAAMGLQR